MLLKEPDGPLTFTVTKRRSIPALERVCSLDPGYDPTDPRLPGELASGTTSSFTFTLPDVKANGSVQTITVTEGTSGATPIPGKLVGVAQLEDTHLDEFFNPRWLRRV